MNAYETIQPFLADDGRLKSYPSRHSKRLVALQYLAGKLEKGRQYTEKEINSILNEWCLFKDPATLRREMYNNRLIDRTKDCSLYWLQE